MDQVFIKYSLYLLIQNFHFTSHSKDKNFECASQTQCNLKNSSLKCICFEAKMSCKASIFMVRTFISNSIEFSQLIEIVIGWLSFINTKIINYFDLWLVKNWNLKWHEQKSSMLLLYVVCAFCMYACGFGVWVCSMSTEPIYIGVEQWNFPYISWIHTPILRSLKRSRIHIHVTHIDERKSKQREMKEEHWQAVVYIWVKPIKPNQI